LRRFSDIFIRKMNSRMQTAQTHLSEETIITQAGLTAMSEIEQDNSAPRQANQAKRRTAGRAGGRASRIAARAAALPEEMRPVRPGLSGGTYKPLTQSDIQKIHDAALEALEIIGLADAPQSGIDVMTKAGAILGDDGRLRYPKSVIEDTLAITRKEITLHGRDEQFDMQLSEKKVYYGCAGAAVQMVEVEDGTYRDSNLDDLFKAAQIVQVMDNVHFFQRPIVARDVLDNLEMDLNTIYASCAGTTKHIGTSISEPHHVPKMVELMHMIAGGEDKFRARPFISNTNCFVVPPMKFATESCEAMEMAIRAGMPVLLLSAGQAGATAPAPLAASIVQAVAECLAGLVYVNALKPGHPAIFGTWPFVSDLRSGAMSGGSGEQALLTAACAQMHHFYGLPGGAAAGIADAKMPNMQSGWEQGISNTLAGMAGLNMVYEAVGMHASLLGFCQESLILGNDMLGQAMRCVRGIEVTDDKVSIDVMKQVCLEGPGHYLGHQQTLDLMQTEYVYPKTADRLSPKEWEEVGRPEPLVEATKRKKEIWANAPKTLIDRQIDSEIRANFNIHV
jgi:trimethylamine--corrinoid protein Co-methyltransferase